MAQKAAAGRTWQPTGDVLETAFSSAEVAESEVTAAGAFKVRSLPGPWLAVTARLRPLGFGVAAFATRGLAQPKLAERAKAGGGRRTRTFEAIRRLIYSQLPLPLGTLPRSIARDPLPLPFAATDRAMET